MGSHTTHQKILPLVIDSLPDHVAVLDDAGVIVYVNRAWRELARDNPPVTSKVKEGSDYLAACLRAAQNGNKMAAELATGIRGVLSGGIDSYTREDVCHGTDDAQQWFVGQVFPLDLDGRQYAVLKGNQDLRSSEDRVRLINQAQRRESINTLAGGIAHDFNNILSAIIGYGEMMEMFEIPEESDMRDSIHQILRSAYRAKNLVDQILTFSRKSILQKKTLNLAEIINEALNFLRASLLPSNIVIANNIKPLPGSVDADPTQLHQVVINLCTNAIQSMGEKGGTLGIRLTDHHLSPEKAAEFSEIGLGTYAKLSISDTGIGIPREIRGRILEPYFTTKNKKEGTGLGLAVIQGIIHQHNGILTFDSQEGQGTTFHVLLPLNLGKR